LVAGDAPSTFRFDNANAMPLSAKSMSMFCHSTRKLFA
jgi:hypothetical protein